MRSRSMKSIFIALYSHQKVCSPCQCCCFHLISPSAHFIGQLSIRSAYPPPSTSSPTLPPLSILLNPQSLVDLVENNTAIPPTSPCPFETRGRMYRWCLRHIYCQYVSPVCAGNVILSIYHFSSIRCRWCRNSLDISDTAVYVVK